MYHFDHWEIDEILSDEYFYKKSVYNFNKNNSNNKIYNKNNTNNKIDKNNSGKKVRYSSIVSVILVPTNKEYIDAGIELWNK
jgi:hypothetical protein